MTKRQQAEIERRAKRLGQILSMNEHTTIKEVFPELIFERAFLTCWLKRQFASHGVFTEPGMWK